MRHVLLGSALCLMGCGGSSEEPPAAVPVPPSPTTQAPPVEESAPDLSALASADAMDGAADKIISQCGVCALHMEGDAAHAVQVGDYTLHMCSAACKDAWEKDPTGSMAALAEAAQ